MGTEQRITVERAVKITHTLKYQFVGCSDSRQSGRTTVSVLCAMSASPSTITIDRTVIETVAEDAALDSQMLAAALKDVDAITLPTVDVRCKRATTGPATVCGRTPDRLALSVPADDWDRLHDRLDSDGLLADAVTTAHCRQARALASESASEPTTELTHGLVTWSSTVAAFVAGGFSLERARVWAFKCAGATHTDITHRVGLPYERVLAHSQAGRESISEARSLVRGLSQVDTEPTAVITVHTDDEAVVLFDDGATVLVGPETVSCSAHGHVLRSGGNGACSHSHTAIGAFPQPAIHAADLAVLLGRDPWVKRAVLENLPEPVAGTED